MPFQRVSREICFFKINKKRVFFLPEVGLFDLCLISLNKIHSSTKFLPSFRLRVRITDLASESTARQGVYYFRVEFLETISLVQSRPIGQ